MAPAINQISVYLELGKQRTFAGAIDWPGWCRSGRSETEALLALVDSGPRYARVLQAAGMAFHAPADSSAFVVVERLEGSSTTDFGAPGAAPASDALPLDDADLRRIQALLQACWRAFDLAVQTARGRELRRGVRGGGRQLERIAQHVLESDAGYLAQLGWKLDRLQLQDQNEQLAHTRQEILQGLAAAARGELPARGPRGGLRWTARYFIRRIAWHVLDHTWEIADRLS